MKKTKIGVFDSGVGGKAVAERLQELFPKADIISVSDSKHVPYGGRRRADIIKLTKRAVRPLVKEGCDAIVIACNTATTNAIGDLRLAYPAIHFVGIEPMVKPAAKLTKTGAIAVLATPGTLKSDRYQELKRQWADKVVVIEPDCHDWATMIERGDADRVDVETVVKSVLRWDADVIVLGCTHYHWLKDTIKGLAGPRVKILEPSDAIGARLDSLLSINSVLPG